MFDMYDLGDQRSYGVTQGKLFHSSFSDPPYIEVGANPHDQTTMTLIPFEPAR